jgi:hypothetical protein
VALRVRENGEPSAADNLSDDPALKKAYEQLKENATADLVGLFCEDLAARGFQRRDLCLVGSIRKWIAIQIESPKWSESFGPCGIRLGHLNQHAQVADLVVCQHHIAQLGERLEEAQVADVATFGIERAEPFQLADGGKVGDRISGHVQMSTPSLGQRRERAIRSGFGSDTTNACFPFWQQEQCP